MKAKRLSFFAALLLAACQHPEGGSAERRLFFPADVGDGTVSVFRYSSAYVPVGGSWLDFSSAPVELSISWHDRKDELKQFTCLWRPDPPPGLYAVGAEREEMRLRFTLTQKGARVPMLRSEWFTIQQWREHHITLDCK